ncbi:MAG: DUF1540 domain-containing protein [Clostridiales bacterium]|nr:DUF1540 domain-containing protein [Clostridiales bacterium]
MSEYDYKKKDETENSADNYGAFDLADSAQNSVSTVGAYDSVQSSSSFDASTGMSSHGSSHQSENSTGSSSSMSLGSSATNHADAAGGTCRSLQGVECQATNCRYHHPGGQCSASSIVVAATDADDKTDTFCNTFTPNTGY